MKEYRINEMFYSLKGEGVWLGEPMLFIRFAGCNLSCPFCDTPDRVSMILTPTQIQDRLEELNPKCERVVITGGEPMLQDPEDLIGEMTRAHLHLETNGTLEGRYDLFDHVCLSPKTLLCDPECVALAAEIKFLVGEPGWMEFIDQFRERYHREINADLLVMPLAKGQREEGFMKSWQDLSEENTHKAIKYCLDNPEFRFTPQLHKYLGIQ